MRRTKLIAAFEGMVYRKKDSLLLASEDPGRSELTEGTLDTQHPDASIHELRLKLGIGFFMALIYLFKWGSVQA